MPSSPSTSSNIQPILVSRTSTKPVKHRQGRRCLAVLDLGQQAFGAVGGFGERLQRQATCLPCQFQPYAEPSRICLGDTVWLFFEFNLVHALP